MSDFGFTDFGSTDYLNAGGYTDVTDGLEDVNVTPQLQLSDYNSTQTGNDWSTLLQAIPLIGSTFASTYNAVNNPSSPSAYSQPQGTSSQGTGPGNAPASAAPSFMSHLTDFNSPYPYVAIGGVLLLVYMMKKR